MIELGECKICKYTYRLSDNNDAEPGICPICLKRINYTKPRSAWDDIPVFSGDSVYYDDQMSPLRKYFIKYADDLKLIPAREG